ncbi:MAG: sulfurtransferase TusA family protein [Actinomycetota bacterium]|nr:sulfurtransferase TusA family protein [Actinomycetota bacterium]
MKEENLQADVVLDAGGLVCPLPAVKMAMRLEKMEIGEVLEVITTDEISKVDLPLWCRQTGNELIEIVEDGATFHIFVRKLKKWW